MNRDLFNICEGLVRVISRNLVGERPVHLKARLLKPLVQSSRGERQLTEEEFLLLIAHPCITFEGRGDEIDRVVKEAWKSIDWYFNDGIASLLSDEDVDPCSVLRRYFLSYLNIPKAQRKLAQDFFALNIGKKKTEFIVPPIQLVTFLHRLTNLKSKSCLKLKCLAQVLVYGCRLQL